MSERDTVAPRRVLVVTNMWPTSDADYTGIFVKQQVDALRVAAPHWSFDVLHVAGPGGRRDYLAAVPRVRRALRGGYDVVHAHYGFTGTTVALARPRVPFVVTLHGNDVNWRWQLPITRFGAKRAARVIAVSDQLRERYDRAGTQVLACGVPTDLFRPMERRAARERLGIPTGARVVLFPAAPANPVKDHALFQAGLAALPPELRASVTPRALGSTRPADMPYEMAAADVVVLTSVAEGSPMVVKEALACGTPVVSTDVGDVARVIGGLPGCAIATRDADAIAAAIVRALEAGGGVDAAAQRRARVFELGLDAPGIAQRLLATYDEVIAAAVRR